MIIQTVTRWRRGAAILGLSLLLAACATPVPRADDVSVRAQERWALLLADDYAGAYEYLSPGFRSSVSSIQYQRKLLLQKIRWTDARYIDSECLETSCKVRISLDFVLLQAVPGVKRYDATQTIVEDWVKADGQWWFVPKK